MSHRPLVARPDPLYHLVLLSLSLGVLLLAALLSVRGRSEVVVPVVELPLPELCMTKRIMGLACPGCGLTRSFISLAHGDFPAAWSYNPAGVWLFAIMALQIPFRTIQLWRIRRGRPEIVFHRATQFALGFFAIALLAQWAIRVSGVPF
jgi:Protein of unknown function (DUF2752)